MASDMAMRDTATGAQSGGGGRLWMFALLLAAAAAIAGISAQRYFALERELTEAALARRASLAALAGATLSERLDRVVDIGVSLASRVQFRVLTANGHWEEAVEILRSVPRDFKYISRASLF